MRNAFLFSLVGVRVKILDLLQDHASKLRQCQKERWCLKEIWCPNQFYGCCHHNQASAKALHSFQESK